MAVDRLKLTNSHCFEGNERVFWLECARGFTAREILDVKGIRQTYFLERDTDGFAIQNGGLQRPQETKIDPYTSMFRFCSAKAVSDYGAKALIGGWWIDYETYNAVTDFAQHGGHSLAQAASLLFAIPGEWSDCAFVGKAVTRTTVRAWVGKGKPATGSISPDQGAGARALAGASVYAPPDYMEIKQFFIPGKRHILDAAFDILWVRPAG